MPSSGGVTVVSMLVFILIFLVGHALNFGLNLLGCFVHDLRLQCLELSLIHICHAHALSAGADGLTGRFLLRSREKSGILSKFDNF